MAVHIPYNPAHCIGHRNHVCPGQEGTRRVAGQEKSPVLPTHGEQRALPRKSFSLRLSTTWEGIPCQDPSCTPRSLQPRCSQDPIRTSHPRGISTWPAGRRGPASAANKPPSPPSCLGRRPSTSVAHLSTVSTACSGCTGSASHPETPRLYTSLLRALQVPTFQQVKNWSLFYFKYRCSIGNTNH